MSDPLEARRRELLGDAEFARLAADLGADTEQKRAELARNVAEAFCSQGQIQADEEGEVGMEARQQKSLREYVKRWANQKAGGKRKKLGKKAKKRSRGRGNGGPFAAAVKQKFGSWGRRFRGIASAPGPVEQKRRAPESRMRRVEVMEDRGQPCKVTWEEAKGRPETAVPLERLPGEVRLSAGFPEPIRFDAAEKRLVYRGFLITSSFRYLLSLSSDLDYVRAIQELNTRCVGRNAEKEGKGWMWVVWGMGILAAAVGVGWMLWGRS